jgi:hypothetical protein
MSNALPPPINPAKIRRCPRSDGGYILIATYDKSTFTEWEVDGVFMGMMEGLRGSRRYIIGCARPVAAATITPSAPPPCCSMSSRRAPRQPTNPGEVSRAADGAGSALAKMAKMAAISPLVRLCGLLLCGGPASLNRISASLSGLLPG